MRDEELIVAERVKRWLKSPAGSKAISEAVAKSRAAEERYREGQRDLLRCHCLTSGFCFWHSPMTI